MKKINLFLEFNGKLIITVFVIIWIFLTMLFIQQGINSSKYNDLYKENVILRKKLKLTKEKLQKSEVKRRIEIQLIQDKVNSLHDFIKRLYPKSNYNYKESVYEALDHPEKTPNLPENLINVYIAEKIKLHGLYNYKYFGTLPLR